MRILFVRPPLSSRNIFLATLLSLKCPKTVGFDHFRTTTDVPTIHSRASTTLRRRIMIGSVGITAEVCRCFRGGLLYFKIFDYVQ